MRVWVALSLWAFAAGCSMPAAEWPELSRSEVTEERRKQATFYMQNFHSQHSRLHAVAHRLMIANKAECKVQAPRVGFAVTTIENMPPTYREHAADVLGYNKEKPSVYWVAEDGPAARAGMKVGDAVLAVDGFDVPLPITTRDAGIDTVDWLSDKLQHGGGRTLRIDVLRANRTYSLTLEPVMGCGIPVFLKTDQTNNAFTEGTYIMFHSAMLRVAQTDAQLALIMGHELAHATQEHTRKEQQNEFVGTLGGAAVDLAFGAIGFDLRGAGMRAGAEEGRLAWSKDFEREADYIGAYYAARAGYDLTGGEHVWRSMSLDNPNSIVTGRSRTHPTSPERFVLLQKAIAEIADKKRRGVALNPEMKSVAQAAAAGSDVVNAQH